MKNTIHKDISPINIFNFVNLRNKILAFLGWPCYILERLTVLDAISTSINKILLDAQISEYNKKPSSTPNAYDNPQDKRKTTPTAAQLHTLHKNYPLSLVQRNYRNTTVTEHISANHSYPQSSVNYVVAHQPNLEDSYE